MGSDLLIRKIKQSSDKKHSSNRKLNQKRLYKCSKCRLYLCPDLLTILQKSSAKLKTFSSKMKNFSCLKWPSLIQICLASLLSDPTGIFTFRVKDYFLCFLSNHLPRRYPYMIHTLLRHEF